MTLYFILGSVAGKVELDETGVLLHDEIRAGLEEVPEHLRDIANDRARARNKYAVAFTGASMSWIPTTHELQIINRTAQIERERAIVAKLNDVFPKKIST